MFAQVMNIGGAWGLGQIAIAVIIVLAVCAVLPLFQSMGVSIPDWLVKIIVIVIVAAVAIVAIKFLLSL